MSVGRLGARLRSGVTTAAALADTAIAAARENRHGAFVLVTAETARSAAAEADRELAAGIDRGPLHGIPVAVKDVIDIAGLPTRAGTRAYAHRVAQADAPAWAALRAAGAVLIGKTRVPELAMDSLTPGTVNPRDPARVCGGSSGGSAAAVAAGIVPLAIGTDTGGSVRIPAALTGIAGLRPTLGAISGAGVLPLSPSQDTVGLLASGPRDCLLAYEIIRRAGGPLPAEGVPGPPPPAGRLVRVGVPAALCGADVAPPVRAAFAAACRALAGSGCEVGSCELPLADAAPPVSWLLMVAEAARTPALAGARADPGISPRVRELLAAGAEVPADDYEGALELAGDIRDSLAGLLAGEADLIALPATPATAMDVTALDAMSGADRAAVAAAYCRFTALASVCGLPAISVPCGSDDDGLPVGLQLIGAAHAERLLCEVAGRVGQWRPGRR